MKDFHPADSGAFEAPSQGADALIGRACCLGALLERLSLELEATSAGAAEQERFAEGARRVLRWLEDAGLQGALSPTERRLLRQPAGSWSGRDRLEAGWRLEALGVIAWALQLVDEMPPYDVQFARVQVGMFGPSGDTPEALGARATLRSPEELARAQEAADGWHWRAVQTQAYFSERRGERTPAERLALRRALRVEARLFGKRYEELTFEEFSLARSIATERHSALNWLWDGEPWDQVSTDTLGLAVPASVPEQQDSELAGRTGSWMDRLLAVLPFLSESGSPTQFAPRVANLLLRAGRATSVGEFLKLFDKGNRPPDMELKGLLTSAFLCALVEKTPEELEAVLASQSADRVRKAILRHAILLGEFGRITQATRRWSTREVLTRFPLPELASLSGASERQAAAFCAERGLRHPLVYRMAARRRDARALGDWARENAALDPGDPNGGFARQTILPWAFESLITETARAGLVELAHELLGLLTQEDQRGSEGHTRMCSAVGVAAARGGRPDIARDLATRRPDAATHAALLLAELPSVDAVLSHLPPPVDDGEPWAMCAAVFWEGFEVMHVRDAWGLLRGIVSLVQRTSCPERDEHLGVASHWGSRLVTRLCRAHAFRQALHEVEETSRITGLQWNDPVRHSIASAAATGGDRELARAILATLPPASAHAMAPLMVDDWRHAELPPRATVQEQFRWAVLALEAIHGRSVAAEGFGVPDRFGGQRAGPA